MNVAHWWNNTDRVTQKYKEKNVQHWREVSGQFHPCSWSLLYKLDIRLGGSHSHYGCGDKTRVKPDSPVGQLIHNLGTRLAELLWQ